MRRFYLFRSDIVALEYYHKYKTLELFKKNCHDYYLLFPIWLLEEDYFDEVIIFRLGKFSDIVFDINGKRFIQKWVKRLDEVLDIPKPEVSFFRGGFRIYDEFTKKNPKFSNLCLYLGAGQRILPQWGGIYDVFLMEDERDFITEKKCLPFYKTASPFIFHPTKSEIKWDVCWPCNFTQIAYKGQEFFINEISKSKYLKSLKIAHCGNRPEVGLKMTKKMGVKNIDFLGYKTRTDLNSVLNKSKIALNLSNLKDGCPRVSTEVLMTGTPLILRRSVRLLDYFRNFCIDTKDKNLEEKIKYTLNNYKEEKQKVLDAVNNELSFENINKKNINLWKKI